MARFGGGLYRHFFKTYTEKVWGVPATEHAGRLGRPADQEPRLRKAIVNAVLPKRNQKEITSLIEEFQYPKYGPGMMWEGCRDLVEAAGDQGRHARRRLTGIHHRGRPRRRGHLPPGRDRVHRQPASHVISSMPIPELVATIPPPPPAEVVAAADDLHYRDFLTVALVVPERGGFPDNWIYIHSPDVKVGRIQNFGSWSPYLVKEGRTCLGLEYFVFEGDETWNMPDDELVALGTHELDLLGLVAARASSGLRGAHAQGIPVLRRRLQGQRRDHPRLARGRRAQRLSRSGATACTSTTTRTTPCTPPC